MERQVGRRKTEDGDIQTINAPDYTASFPYWTNGKMERQVGRRKTGTYRQYMPLIIQLHSHIGRMERRTAIIRTSSQYLMNGKVEWQVGRRKTEDGRRKTEDGDIQKVNAPDYTASFPYWMNRKTDGHSKNLIPIFDERKDGKTGWKTEDGDVQTINAPDYTASFPYWTNGRPFGHLKNLVPWTDRKMERQVWRRKTGTSRH